MLIWILLWHFLGDFVLQSHAMASRKSKSWWALTYHVAVYTLVINCGVGLVYLSPYLHPAMQQKYGLLMGWFAVITFATHFATDAITSRLSGKYFAAALDRLVHKDTDAFGRNMHDFFVVIGLDQFIHALTLWATLRLLDFPV